MFKRFIPIMIFIVSLLLFPTEAFAVDYSITRTQFDAYLQENGNVIVEEKHTYEFEGKFNGITRELIPKNGTSIAKFQASENGQELEIEKDETLYKVHRKGKDEIITVDLKYIIDGGVDVYSDVGEFYWPFFDKSNESTYENLTVTIHPPRETNDVIAFGYDEAFDKAAVQNDGTVVYKFGKVSDGKNGDIRVAYDKALFPAATDTSDKEMKGEIYKAQQQLYNDYAAKAEMRNKINMIGLIVIPIFGLIILGLMLRTVIRSLNQKRAVERETNLSDRIPALRMSMPATIHFTNYKLLPPEAMSAALMDLVRQGYVENVSEERFRILKRDGTMKHERILMEWLFDEIGESDEFSLDDLTNYAKKKNNHETYQKFETRWKQAVAEETKEHNLYEDKTKYRAGIGISSILLLPPVILFPIYELFEWMLLALLLMAITITYALAYNPKTDKGLRIILEWKIFKERFFRLSEDDWQSWSEDDRMRAFIYGLGTKNKKIIKKNEDYANAFYNTKTGSPEVAYSMDMSTLIIVSSVATTSFHSAHRSTASSSGGYSSTGGSGAGGGGGGSGAF
ncbi:DUF2207 domain-containing protein [Alkalihalobacillus sp. TS-13]|uniref:DUF2207 domain-containing protein n=1 Tax=Alkalihalobacillus sp. TS-13 TaxID=2842455 RepID=UPI001C87AA9D|nr:DUF2207 domain-containing protein [Alkalihalobacillus sp. TS-13]